MNNNSLLAEMLSPPVWAFDMDGVVVDSSAVHAQAFREIFKEFGIATIDYDEIAGRSTREVVIELLKKSGKRVSPELIDDLTKKKQDRALEMIDSGSGLVIPPGLLDLLMAGKKRGKMLCLVTSASGERTAKTLNLLNLKQFFSFIVSADDVTKGKPDPEPYLALLPLTGINDPKKYLVIEDSANGVDSALLAGMHVVHYAPGSVKTNKAHAAINSFDMLVGVLQGGNY